MKLLKKSVLLLVVFLLVSPLISAKGKDKKVSLKLRLKKGTSYNLTVSTNQNISQMMRNREIKMTQKMHFGYLYDVVDVNASGDATVNVVYKSVKYEHESPMGSLSYDSQKPSGEVPKEAASFSSLVGKSFTMVISPSGKVLSLKGVDKMTDDMLKASGVEDPTMKAKMAERLKKMFGKETMMEAISLMMEIYPDKPVGVGDSWKKKMVVKRGFPMKIDSVWTLKERKQGVAVIGVRSKIRPNPDAAPMVMGDMSMNYRVSGEQKGTVQVDEATGFFIGGRIAQVFKGQVDAKKGSEKSDELNYLISVKGVTTRKSTK